MEVEGRKGENKGWKRGKEERERIAADRRRGMQGGK